MAVLDVLTAQSRRLGAQHGAEPPLLSPLELLRLAAAHAAVPDLLAFLVLCCAPAFFCLPLVLVGLVVETLVLLVDMVLVAVMVTVLLLVVVFLLAVVLLALLLPDLLVAVLLHQELRLHLVAAEAAAAAPLGSGEM